MGERCRCGYDPSQHHAGRFLANATSSLTQHMDAAPVEKERTIMSTMNTSPGQVSKTKWIVQLVVGFLCFGNIITVILAILGLVKADTDLESANKFYKWGWIAYVACIVLYILLWVVMLATGILAGILEGSASYETY